jgi:hypothetical protein
VRLGTPRRRDAVPFGDLPELGTAGRRTALLRVGLGLALAATLAGAVLVARSAGSGRAAVLPEGASTAVVAVDMSASIAGPIHSRVATTLRGIVAANQAIGLVMFSDTAYSLLPPNSPASALLQFIRFFTPERFVGSTPVFAQSPWDRFSGGTRISSGLSEAQASLRRAHVKHGAILLVSDLDDSASDGEPLAAEALALKHAHIPVRIVPLSPSPANARLFAALFGSDAFVDPRVFTHRAGQRALSVAASTPWALLGLGALLVLLLAANERANARLAVGAPA